MLLGIARDPGRIEIVIGRLGIGGKGEVEIVNFSILVIRLDRKFLRNFIFYWNAYL